MKTYAVIGLGLFGQALARQLCMLGAEVLAMDVRPALVQQVANDVTHAVVGDAQDKEVLRALGVRDMDCAVIAIGDDLAASVLITMNLQELGVPYIVCKAEACTAIMCWIILSFLRNMAFWKFPLPRPGSERP